MLRARTVTAEQVQAWLEIAQASGNVQNLIVLSDNSEGAGLGAAGSSY